MNKKVVPNKKIKFASERVKIRKAVPQTRETRVVHRNLPLPDAPTAIVAPNIALKISMIMSYFLHELFRQTMDLLLREDWWVI